MARHSGVNLWHIRAEFEIRDLIITGGFGVHLADLYGRCVHADTVEDFGATGALPAAGDDIDDRFHRRRCWHDKAARLQLAARACVIHTHVENHLGRNRALLIQIVRNATEVRPARHLKADRLLQRAFSAILRFAPEDDAPQNKQQNNQERQRVGRDVTPH